MRMNTVQRSREGGKAVKNNNEGKNRTGLGNKLGNMVGPGTKSSHEQSEL